MTETARHRTSNEACPKCGQILLTNGAERWCPDTDDCRYSSYRPEDESIVALKTDEELEELRDKLASARCVFAYTKGVLKEIQRDHGKDNGELHRLAACALNEIESFSSQ